MPLKSDLLTRAYAVKTPDEVRALYKDWATQYDQDLLGDDLQYVAPKMAAAVLAQQQPDLTAKVLDVGCGTGLSGVALREVGFQSIDGVDLSVDMIAQARNKGLYGSLTEANLLEGMPLADNSYQVAFSVGTFTHGHVGPDALSEVLRVVAPGGLFCLTIHAGVFDDLGYAAAFQRLEQSGLGALVALEETDYIRAEGLRSKVACLKAL